MKVLVYFADGDLRELSDIAMATLIESVSAVNALPAVKILSIQLSLE